MILEPRCTSGLHAITSSAPCSKCAGIRRKIWNSADPRAAQSSYNLAHAVELSAAKAFCEQRDKFLAEQSLALFEDSKQRQAASAAEKREASLSRRRAYSNNARALRIKAEGLLSDKLLDRLYKLQKGKCPCCKRALGKDFHMDHIIPLSKGGPNTDDNIQLLRSRCNLVKSAMDPLLFMQINGFLI